MLDGLDAKPRSIRGEDTFQALTLAVLHVRGQLEIEEERGTRFVLDGSDEPFDWRLCWFSDHGLTE